MGCFGSRDSHRQAAYAEDYNLVTFGFRKADLENLSAFTPVDKIVYKCIGDGKEVAEGELGAFKEGKFDNADKYKATCKSIFELLVKMQKKAAEETETKEDAFMKKYPFKTVKEQLDAVLTALAATDADLKWPEEETKADPATDDKGKTGEEEGKGATDEANEGGEAAAAEGTFHDVLLAQLLANSVLFDILKSAVLSVELDSFDPLDFSKMGKGLASLSGLLPEAKDWAGAATLLTILVDTKEGEATEKDLFAKTKVSADDLEELKEAAANKDKCALVFPGLTVWAASESECSASTKGGEDTKEVTFCLKGVKACDLDGKSVISRFIGKIDECKEDTNTYTLSEFGDYAFETFADYKKKLEGAGEAVASGAAAATTEAEKPADKTENEA